ncbi:MAG: DUF3943 domain-containing protein [Bdellovibrio sp.]|nr:DUF3943 domain-containing protein [Bdellovibrio sp.]
MKPLLRYIAFGTALFQLQAAMAVNFGTTTKGTTTPIDWNQQAVQYQQFGNTPVDPLEELVKNPFGKLHTQKDIDRLSRQKVQGEQRTRMLRGDLITVDTRDQESCLAIQSELKKAKQLKSLNNVADLCKPDANKPIATVMILNDTDEVEWRRQIDTSKITSTEKNIYTATRNVSIAALGVAGALYMMPESVSKWDKSKMKNLGKNWRENVSAGPHMDSDSWAINFIGHPYSGAAYYQVARHTGMGMMQSFGYSVLMSTFFWEFGVEAFAEQPSIQDLFFTPVFGSIFGEVFYRTEMKIRQNNGEVFGSKALGSALILLMNPMGSIADKINDAMGSDVIQNASMQWVMRRPKTLNGMEAAPIYGFEVQFRF